MKKTQGITLIELTIVMAIAGFLIVGIIKLMKSSSDIWRSSVNNVNIQQQGRTAVEDMTRFIRQASAPDTSITPLIGVASSKITFTFMQDTATFKSMSYYLSGDSIYRVFDGSTQTLVDGGVSRIYFNHVSSYVVRIETFTLTSGSGRTRQSLTVNRTIHIRNQ
ncbi:MAG: prepilin-type N-terminal cleavage/methylation domain-containing protein [bacterium]